MLWEDAKDAILRQMRPAGVIDGCERSERESEAALRRNSKTTCSKSSAAL
jgi:hypothetical protein